ncbi:MAG: YbaN family protein [Kangiellaceae bacterium]|nr:YbaN family protein [Kangiellaceae bacterium]
MSENPIVKYVLIVTGVLLVFIGLIGIVLPGLPTTIFLILAAACFANTSPALHNKLLTHRWFGPIIKNWDETRSIPRRAKFLALLMIALSYLYTWFSVDELTLRLVIALIILFPVIYVIRLPLTENLTKNKPKN